MPDFAMPGSLVLWAGGWHAGVHAWATADYVQRGMARARTQNWCETTKRTTAAKIMAQDARDTMPKQERQ